MLAEAFILGKAFIQDLRLCRQRTGEGDKIMEKSNFAKAAYVYMCSVDEKFTGSVQTYSCHSTLHALPLNAPAIAHNDTLYL